MNASSLPLPGPARDGRSLIQRLFGAAWVAPKAVDTVAASPAAPLAHVGASLHDSTLEGLRDPILVIEGSSPTDLTGRRIIFANAAARALFRVRDTGTLLASAVRDPNVLECIDESLFGGLQAETAYEPRDTQERVWKVQTTPLKLPPGVGTAGAACFALAHFHDETEVRRAHQARGDFLANASHELRTPLASLSGFIETLRGHARDDAEARDQFLRIMSIQAERMSRLIDDLMSLSRIELSEHVPPQGVCDLDLCVRDVADTLKPLTAEKKVTVSISAPGGPASVIGDRDQITQVVQNLIDNALKYSPEGGTVEVQLAPDVTRQEAMDFASRGPAMAAAGGGRLSLLTPDRSERDRYAVIRIVDHGPGMKREHLPRLTERFYRVEGQKSGDRLGTGLGLAIVKHIVNRHRGGVAVESAPGRGTAFVVYLPMADEADGLRS